MASTIAPKIPTFQPDETSPINYESLMATAGTIDSGAEAWSDWRELKLWREAWRNGDMATQARQHWLTPDAAAFFDPAATVTKVSS